MSSGSTTERFDMFKDMVQKAKIGQVSSQEFLAWLASNYEIMDQRANAYVDYMEETGYIEYQTQEVLLSFEGLEDYDAGCQQFFLYCEDGDLSRLDAGLELIWQGNEKINEAMRLNRQFRKSLEEEWDNIYE
jgi:hypothetical protein